MTRRSGFGNILTEKFAKISEFINQNPGKAAIALLSCLFIIIVITFVCVLTSKSKFGATAPTVLFSADNLSSLSADQLKAQISQLKSKITELTKENKTSYKAN
jgi:hypothetical protein